MVGTLVWGCLPGPNLLHLQQCRGNLVQGAYAVVWCGSSMSNLSEPHQHRDSKVNHSITEIALPCGSCSCVCVCVCVCVWQYVRIHVHAYTCTILNPTILSPIYVTAYCGLKHSHVMPCDCHLFCMMPCCAWCLGVCRHWWRVALAVLFQWPVSTGSPHVRASVISTVRLDAHCDLTLYTR